MQRPEDVLVLASASPRRRELLARAGIPFEVVPSGVEEKAEPGETPTELAARLAAEKARAVARRIGAPPTRVVLGADTLVVVDDEVLGKPEDPEHAASLLARLVGRRHRVCTGVAVVASHDGTLWRCTVTSTVTMRPAGAEEIRAYVATGEPLDKAGGYAFQGGGRRFVTGVVGSETNVIGLPVEETLALLRKAGLPAAGAP
jgi:septum formation protein